MVDLHRHDDYSLFDGLGKPIEMARLAKEYGYEALGSTNHGTASGLVEHWLGCKEVGIKAILGVEVYFQPAFNKDKRKYHLCLICKNLEGYKNLNRILTIANKDNFYYKATVTFELLEKYHEGLICTSACIAGFPAAAIAKGNVEATKKALKKFKSIFGDDFYVEIQPYKLIEEELQERVNEKLIILADKLKIKCILTSDSHYGRKEDFDTYLKMHCMKLDPKKPEQYEARVQELKAIYKQRYMPKPNELVKRFCKMHPSFAYGYEQELEDNTQEVADKCESDFLGELELTLPKFKEGLDSIKTLEARIHFGLKRRGKFKKNYIDRCAEEFEIIKEHGFEDYFLIVQEYVSYAKSKGIAVGPGRGSVCNCLVAYALGITDVDSLYFGLDFSRFLRKDKKKMPDIDIDFETSRRGEVIDFLINRHKGKAVQICSYGLYKIDNLLNDLFKVCGVTEVEDKKAIKAYVNANVDGESKVFNYELVMDEPKCKQYNARFDNIIKHFGKMYKKVKYIGTHAAGVAIVKDEIVDYTSVERHGDRFSSAYDLNNLEKINALKFDMLGLRTLSIIKELEELTDDKFEDSWLEDEKIFEEFAEGRTDAIFQFERQAAAGILVAMNADCMEDVIAANALNRPGPLGLKMPEQYAYNKKHAKNMNKSIYFELTKDTYGTVVYQEQITAICRSIGKLDWADSDKVLKFMKGSNPTERALKEKEREENRIRDLFVAGAKEAGIKKSEALEIFSKLLTYTFNKGHATGYALIAVQMMYYKVYYPEYFWYVNLKYAPGEAEEWKYKRNAVRQGSVILLPHVNGCASYSIKNVDGDDCIMEGLRTIKGVGETAAKTIEEERIKNGDYQDYDDFAERLPKRVINSKVLRALEENGAMLFNEKEYYKRVEAYNKAINMRS